MKKNQLMQVLAVTAISLSAIIASCSKDQSAGASASTDSQNVSMFLTDGPGLFNAVNLDISSLEVLVDTSTNTRRHDGCDWDHIGDHGPKPDSSLVWQNLGISAGIYDILSLRNGIDTLLVQANIPKGSIRLIRINLGTNSTVTKDSVTYPLQIPPGAPAYILIKLRGDEWENYSHNHFRLWLDFDIQRSIIQVSSTTFYLRPFINCFIDKNTGSIHGVVLPHDARTLVTVSSATDTAYAIPGRDGEFKVRGLKDGNYSALIHSFNGYKDTTITNIVIQNASKVNEGIIMLHK
jgi:hypothetical protein